MKKRSRQRSGPRTRRKSSGGATLRKRLLNLLFEKAFRVSDEPVFRLASGAVSRYYVDCKKVTLDPTGAFLVGRLVYDRVRGLRPDGIGGLTLGADPIAQAVSLTSHLKRNPIPAFIVRKEPKGHGSASGGASVSGGWIEGNLAPGSRVVVVDDVITTGGSTLKAIDRLQEYGCKILKVVALLDRREGGTEAIAARGHAFEALFQMEDLLRLVSKTPVR
jgi:orotate phosphoribosyltransferase